MTRLTDLLRGQSSQEALGPEANSAIRSPAPTSLLLAPSTPTPSVAEINWYQCACLELLGIKRAVQARQPWTVDELVRIASGIVASIGVHGGHLDCVVRHFN